MLLRAAVGIMVLFGGAIELTGSEDLRVGSWVAGVLAVIAGIALLVGFMTPVAAVLAGLSAVGLWLSVIPGSGLDLFPSKPMIAFLAVVAVVVALLGPGAFSVDARLFGLREIIIPRSR